MLPLYTLELVVLPAQTDFVVTVAAVNGFARAWFERHFGVLTALRTNRGKHLSYRPVGAVVRIVASAVSLTFFSGRAAGWAALWLIGIAFSREEFLLSGVECKSRATIGANEGFVLITHMNDLLLTIFGKSRSSNS